MLALLKMDPAKIMTTALTMYWMVSLFVTKPKKEENSLETIVASLLTALYYFSSLL